MVLEKLGEALKSSLKKVTQSIFFDEKLEPYHYAGTLLVFFGVYLAKKNYEIKT